ncbi:MAG: hypothetical protein KIT16_23745 [Rhodospirillaceae bacterium]|nr:hypothetical protein [Rhodospirillaceae bacterium]
MRLALAVFVACLVPSLATAQSRGGALCKDGALPFAVGAANRIMGAALNQAVTGKRLGYVRESLRNPGVWVNNGRTLRPDGSMAYTCEFSRSPSGPWQPCTSFGSTTNQARGARDVGVWAVEGNALCMTGASFGETSRSCFSIHRQGGALAAKRLSGPAAVCIEGAVTLQ